VVGEALNQISKQGPEISQAVMNVMEVENMLKSSAEIEVVPENSRILVQLGDGQAS